MTIRFFILMAHYRSTVDFSSEALEAAEKGFARLQEAYTRLQKIQPSNLSTFDFQLATLRQRCADAMDDDLNSPMVLQALFDSARVINTIYDQKASISSEDLDELRKVWKDYAIDILGLRLGDEMANDKSQMSNKMSAFNGAVDLLLDIRLDAKRNKDWATSDKIRNNLTELGFQIKDTKDGYEWTL